MPHANSRFSRPRAISPRASDGTLPCSAVRCAASSWRCVSTRFRILNMISVRFDSDVARQPGKAALAAATAAPSSSAEAKSTTAGDLAGRGIEDLALATGGPGDPSAADPVADPARGRRGRCGPIRVLRPASWETSRRRAVGTAMRLVSGLQGTPSSQPVSDRAVRRAPQKRGRGPGSGHDGGPGRLSVPAGRGRACADGASVRVARRRRSSPAAASHDAASRAGGHDDEDDDRARGPPRSR